MEELAPERDLARTPLLQVTFVLQNALSMTAASKSKGLELSSFAQSPGLVKFDLELAITEVEQGMTCSLSYDAELFDAVTILRMAGHLTRLIEGIVNEPDKRIDELSILTPAEQRQLNEEWNDTDTQYPEAESFPQLFEQQVNKRPEAIAVSFQQQYVSYGELNRRVNTLAQSLSNHGVGPEVAVSVITRRNIDLLISILAVFKAGGVYVPIDPLYPPNRLRHILSLSESRVILTSNESAQRLEMILAEAANGERPKMLEIEELSREAEKEQSLFAPCYPRNLAYLIYTSGSTGQPKGAMIEHRGMLNHLFAKITTLSLGEADIIAETASQSFDISVWQFLAALLVGGHVRIIDDERAHVPARLIEEVSENQVTVLEVVPSMLQPMLQESEKMPALHEGLPAMRVLVVTGETLPPRLCRSWLSKYPQIPLLNAYGPTECSDDVTQQVVTIAPHQEESCIPIGRPLSNTRTYVTDESGWSLPIGTAGELYVGGAGVGRGYFKDGWQTANSFVPDPCGKEPGARLYRTGDRTRYRQDGRIDFLGRIDYQVKIRGYRIELGEVEAALASHTGIREAVVVASADERGGQKLVGYFVGKGDHGLGLRELQSYLKGKLPDYMVPSAYVELPQLPLTSNGKLDRKRLPAPAAVEIVGEREAPSTPVEEIIQGIWAEVLRLEQVGMRGNFL